MKTQLSAGLLEGATIDPRWAAGPFMGIKLMPAKAKGKRFEEIAEELFQKRGHAVNKPVSSDHDRIVDGEKIEIKGSTITRGSDDCFSFLQIRPAQDYDHLVLETFWFDGTIQFFKIPKASVVSMIEQGIFKKQHGGNRAESGTFCYNGNLIPFQGFHWFTVQIG